jgi:hypothetical protein
MAKKQVGGQAGKVHLSFGVVIRRNALARLMICFLGRQRWLRSRWAGRPEKVHLSYWDVRDV